MLLWNHPMAQKLLELQEIKASNRQMTSKNVATKVCCSVVGLSLHYAYNIDLSSRARLYGSVCSQGLRLVRCDGDIRSGERGA